ncbi:uncharacterized protein LAESUDRAFT_812952 [Laetiporus sulphureus 93-53]|uniref:Uncharacterized protein n=1 Tax=Laetiporus sulphureus 93-53 TaxID=1314785 RepID=A0A165E796_9APHY|nr:uncharacterized protein LAESUDRAFT_812952 [Laetiporus sulphureus 93-53]KZT06376.1 hypothetical protein LAESUDRAFT_812952 [Laetiporus sulphureus 93-53]
MTPAATQAFLSRRFTFASLVGRSFDELTVEHERSSYVSSMLWRESRSRPAYFDHIGGPLKSVSDVYYGTLEREEARALEKGTWLEKDELPNSKFVKHLQVLSTFIPHFVPPPVSCHTPSRPGSP